jgi:hypothetical protein
MKSIAFYNSALPALFAPENYFKGFGCPDNTFNLLESLRRKDHGQQFGIFIPIDLNCS